MLSHLTLCTEDIAENLIATLGKETISDMPILQLRQQMPESGRIDFLKSCYSKIEQNLQSQKRLFSAVSRYCLGGILDAIAAELKTEEAWWDWLDENWAGSKTKQRNLRQAYRYFRDRWDGAETLKMNPDIAFSAVYVLAEPTYRDAEPVHDRAREIVYAKEVLTKSRTIRECVNPWRQEQGMELLGGGQSHVPIEDRYCSKHPKEVEFNLRIMRLLREWRLDMDLYQSHASDLLHPSSLSRVERGERMFSFWEFCSLLAFYHKQNQGRYSNPLTKLYEQFQTLLPEMAELLQDRIT